MLGLVSRLQPPTHSRTTRTLTYSSPVNWNVNVHPRRGLVDVVSGVVHDASGVVHDVSNVGHDVGHVVGDILTGKPSKLPGDVAKTGADVVKAAANAGKGVAKVVHSVVDVFENAVKPPGTAGSGHGSGEGDPNHGGGSDGGTQTGQDPQPPVPTGAGGGEDEQYSHPVSSKAADTPTSSTLYLSAYSTPIPSSPTLYNSPDNGVSNAVPIHTHRPSPAASVDVLAPSGGSPGDGQTVEGVTLAPSSTASTTQWSTTMDTLPSNSSGAAAAHRKGFPLAAAAAIGSVLGFLVVSVLFWAFWLYLRKRRRAFHAVYLPPRRMLSLSSGCTVSTVPLFISASEAGVRDEPKNPFRHPLDVHEDDPFDAASLWRSSTTRSESTLSV